MTVVVADDGGGGSSGGCCGSVTGPNRMDVMQWCQQIVNAVAMLRAWGAGGGRGDGSGGGWG